jgi:hypothetical protein
VKIKDEREKKKKNYQSETKDPLPTCATKK